MRYIEFPEVGDKVDCDGLVIATITNVWEDDGNSGVDWEYINEDGETVEWRSNYDHRDFFTIESIGLIWSKEKNMWECACWMEDVEGNVY